MKLKLFIIFLSIAFYGNATDSVLFKKRLAKINLLFNDLKSIQYQKWNDIKDTIWLFPKYDNLTNKYVKIRHYGKYNSSASLSQIHSLVYKDDEESILLFKQQTLACDTNSYKNEILTFFDNTIICYFKMYGDEYEGIYFTFKKNTDELLAVISAGGNPKDYEDKKRYLNSLNQ